MTVVQPIPQNKVLVTGANGFLAMSVIQQLLDDGYSVRGTVRSEEKGKSLSKKYEKYGEQFEWVIVKDIVKEGAFDEAVKGVAAIEHLASPLDPGGVEPELFIDPAVQGTVGVLRSALRYGSSVKRIVITSSTAAISQDAKESKTFDESHWGDDWVEQTKAHGKDAPYMTKYRASKTLAEKAAWKFAEEHKGEVDWDIVTLNPPFILGASYLDTTSPENLPSSLNILYSNLFSPEGSNQVNYPWYPFVHVKDVTRAHVQALNTPAAGGERIIVSAGKSTWDETRDLIRNLYPDLVQKGVISPASTQSSGTAQAAISFSYDNAKSKKIFGIEYRGLEESIRDSIDDFRARGFLEGPTPKN